MKTIFVATLLAAVSVAPALAQDMYLGAPMQQQQPEDAFAQAWPGGPDYDRSFADTGTVHSGNPAWDVYGSDGQYLGSDPDPFIRNDLARERPGHNDD